MKTYELKVMSTCSSKLNKKIFIIDGHMFSEHKELCNRILCMLEMYEKIVP